MMIIITMMMIIEILYELGDWGKFGICVEK